MKRDIAGRIPASPDSAVKRATRAVTSCQAVAADHRTDELTGLLLGLTLCTTRPRFGRRRPQGAGRTATSRFDDKVNAICELCVVPRTFKLLINVTAEGRSDQQP